MDSEILNIMSHFEIDDVLFVRGRGIEEQRSVQSVMGRKTPVRKHWDQTDGSRVGYTWDPTPARAQVSSFCVDGSQISIHPLVCVDLLLKVNISIDFILPWTFGFGLKVLLIKDSTAMFLEGVRAYFPLYVYVQPPIAVTNGFTSVELPENIDIKKLSYVKE
ncbi:hypothetical protein DV515_00005287 [Chloebia gouldiae]|uniref:Uncharacterized protein n=1 Tax=Chloebia gouldiae TaxID=44316 RepID=A0A3L8SQH3_CHLGU|nr:hypothetical protein DV515_00005287 [Chloebia gouldiae]